MSIASYWRAEQHEKRLRKQGILLPQEQLNFYVLQMHCKQCRCMHVLRWRALPTVDAIILECMHCKRATWHDWRLLHMEIRETVTV